MNTTANGVEHMTDFQFRAIMDMVREHLQNVKTLEQLEQAKKHFERLASGVTGTSRDEEDGKVNK